MTSAEVSGRALVLRAGDSPDPTYDVAVTPASAGWTHTSLHVVTLAAGGRLRLPATDEERLVVPLVGGATVQVDSETESESFALVGRPDVFSGPSDVAYAPPGTAVTLASPEGGRYAVCGAIVATGSARRGVARRIDAGTVPVERRGAGQASRLVRNFGTVETLDADALIACEVVTPGGNWSSYPAHKHDQATADESALEEIYYFEVAPGPGEQPGFGYHRTTSSEAGEIDVLAEVRTGDTALVPFGWHGPCVAAPGHDLYYLNVMAGPGERAWRITDHPDQAWVRESWRDQAVDPRLEDRA